MCRYAAENPKKGHEESPAKWESGLGGKGVWQREEAGSADPGREGGGAGGRLARCNIRTQTFGAWRTASLLTGLNKEDAAATASTAARCPGRMLQPRVGRGSRCRLSLCRFLKYLH